MGDYHHAHWAVSVPGIHQGLVGRVSEPLVQLSRIRIPLAPLEKTAEPAWNTALHRDLGIGMKAGDCAKARGRVAIEPNWPEIARLERPLAQHPTVLVPLATTTVCT